MLTIHVWPKWLKEFLLTHPLYKSPLSANAETDAAIEFTICDLRLHWGI